MNQLFVNKSMTVCVVGFLFLPGCLMAGCGETSVDDTVSDPVEDEVPRHVPRAPQSVQLDDIRANLQVALSEAWPADLNVGLHLEEKSNDFIKRAPERLASALTQKADFAFSEIRRNGRSVYRSRSGSELLKVNAVKGYMKFIDRRILPGNADVMATLDDDGVQAMGRRYFVDLGLPEDEIGTVAVKTIMGAGHEEDGTWIEPDAVAKVVEYTRQLNGIDVFDSIAKVFIDLEGRPFRVSVRWPKFKLSAIDELKAPDDLLNDVSRRLAQTVPKHHHTRLMKSNFGYWFNEETLLFEPAICTTAAWRKDEGVTEDDGVTPYIQTMTYSLVRGMVK